MNDFPYKQTQAEDAAWAGALRMGLVLILLCGGLYPALTVAIAGNLFPWQATGSLVRADGEAVGAQLVGQPFASDRYFYGRPSAAGYDPTEVVGSNLAPSNPDLRARAKQRSAAIARREGVAATAIPVDLIAASGSGIDPHISPAAARLQAERVATARGLPVAEVRAAIRRHTREPVLGVLGQPRVNVLALNLALDAVGRGGA